MSSVVIRARRGWRGELVESFTDIRKSLSRRSLWSALAWHDIVTRYRGSILGPFWITISMAVTVLGIGLLYAQIFKVEPRQYLPWVALGIVGWTMISTTIVDGCDLFIGSGAMIRQSNLPMFTFVWRMVLRNIIIFAHHLPVIIGTFIFSGLPISPIMLLFFIGFALVMVNLTWVCLIIGIICAQYRDVPQIIQSVLQVIMFITPVFWTTSSLHSNHLVLVVNPFFYALDVMRAPLLDTMPHPNSYPVLICLAIAGWIVAIGYFSHVRRRLVHFL